MNVRNAARGSLKMDAKITQLEMLANAPRDSRPAEHTWRPLFNVAKFG